MDSPRNLGSELKTALIKLDISVYYSTKILMVKGFYHTHCIMEALLNEFILKPDKMF